jgi:hypothetical protein
VRSVMIHVRMNLLCTVLENRDNKHVRTVHYFILARSTRYHTCCYPRRPSLPTSTRDAMRAATAAFLSFLPTAVSFATTKRPSSVRASSNLMAKLGDSIEFAKYEGLGNDFILIDDRDKSDPSLTPEQSERLCNRNFGIGGDGVIFALKAPEGKIVILCYNDYNM